MGQKVDFLGLNTFIYEPCGWDVDLQGGMERIETKVGSFFVSSQVSVVQNLMGAPSYPSNLIGIKNARFSPYLAEINDYFPALCLRRNGPFGFPTWKQVRVGQNHLTRRQRKHNIFTYVEEPGPERKGTLNGRIRHMRDKYSSIKKYFEAPIVSKFKPIELVAGITDEDTSEIRRVQLNSTLGNETVYFSHHEIDKYYSVEPDENENYNTLKGMYLNGALDSERSPLDSFEYTKYTEVVYPSIRNTYRDHVRTRVTYTFPWNDDITKRIQPGVALIDHNQYVNYVNNTIDNGFGFQVPYQSDWVLDAGWNSNTTGAAWMPEQDGNLLYSGSSDYGTASYDDFARLVDTFPSVDSSSIFFYPIGGSRDLWDNGNFVPDDRSSYNYRTSSFITNSAGGEGVLMNSYCWFADWRQVVESPLTQSVATIDEILTSSCVYSRKHIMPTYRSLTTPAGMDLDFVDTEQDRYLNIHRRFGGATPWTANATRRVRDKTGNYVLKPKEPMDDSYDDWALYPRLVAKDHSIVPEFRISNHVETYEKQGLTEQNLGLFDMTGGLATANSSTGSSFFKTYTNSDFMKHFEIIRKDHDEFVDPTAISLKCKAIKKFLPYDGFYPAQRTVDLAKQFYKSYGDHFDLLDAKIEESDLQNIQGAGAQAIIEFYPQHFNAYYNRYGPVITSLGGYYQHIENNWAEFFGVAHNFQPSISSLTYKQSGSQATGLRPQVGNLTNANNSNSGWSVLRHNAGGHFPSLVSFEVLLGQNAMKTQANEVYNWNYYNHSQGAYPNQGAIGMSSSLSYQGPAYKNHGSTGSMTNFNANIIEASYNTDSDGSNWTSLQNTRGRYGVLHGATGTPPAVDEIELPYNLVTDFYDSPGSQCSGSTYGLVEYGSSDYTAILQSDASFGIRHINYLPDEHIYGHVNSSNWTGKGMRGNSYGHPISFKSQRPTLFIGDNRGNYIAFVFIEHGWTNKSRTIGGTQLEGLGLENVNDSRWYGGTKRFGNWSGSGPKPRNWFAPAFRRRRHPDNVISGPNVAVDLPTTIRTTGWYAQGGFHAGQRKRTGTEGNDGAVRQSPWDPFSARVLHKSAWDDQYDSLEGHASSDVLFHEKHIPVIFVSAPKKNHHATQVTTDWQDTSYYAAKYLAEAINAINEGPDVWPQLIPMFSMIFKDENDTPYYDLANSQLVRKWQIQAQVEHDKTTQIFIPSPGFVPSPYSSRVKLTRTNTNDEDPKTYANKIINWNAGCRVHYHTEDNELDLLHKYRMYQYDLISDPGQPFSGMFNISSSIWHMQLPNSNLIGTQEGMHVFNTSSWTDPIARGTIARSVISSFEKNKDSLYARNQPMLAPLFAPGVLYNTIKSGVACDYPMMTDQINRVLGSVSSSYSSVTGSVWMIGSRGTATSSFIESRAGTSFVDWFINADQGGLMGKPADLTVAPTLNANVWKTASLRDINTSGESIWTPDKMKKAYEVLALKKNQASNDFAGFNLRIPFEALVEPENYMANTTFINQEPDQFLYYDRYLRVEYETRWDGQGDLLYKKMAHNFLAEVADFFLIGGEIKKLESLDQGNPNFGNVDYVTINGVKKPLCYKMRVKMYRSMTKKGQSIYSNGVYVDTPQDYIPTSAPTGDDLPRQTLTMYSRPSAFGPPSWDGNFQIQYKTPDHVLTGSDNRYGYNFPFTPPYYHGEAWADITFKPTEVKKYTLSEIINSSSVDYYRYWHPFANTALESRAGNTDSTTHFTTWTSSLANTTGIDQNYYAPQHPLFINDNAMQLSSTLNLFGRTNPQSNTDTSPTISRVTRASPAMMAALDLTPPLLRPRITSPIAPTINVEADRQDSSKWVIQPKFETPVLNFNHLTCSTSPHVWSFKWNLIGQTDDGITDAHLKKTTVNSSLGGNNGNYFTTYDGQLEHTIYFVSSSTDTSLPARNVNPIKIVYGGISDGDTTNFFNTMKIAIEASSSYTVNVDTSTGQFWLTGSKTYSIDSPGNDTSLSNSSFEKSWHKSDQQNYAYTAGSAGNLELNMHAPESTTVGMWHQYGLVPTGSQGIFMRIDDIPQSWNKGALGVHTAQGALTASLADLVGFSKESVRLGEVANAKMIYEAVVAVPYIEENNQRKFFEIPRRDIQNALDPNPAKRTVGETVVQMARKMQKYVFPPSMDFLRNAGITPFAMYIFEFRHLLRKQDLLDIWQNLPPDFGTRFEEVTSTISHDLLSHELLGGGTSVDDPNINPARNRDIGIPINNKLRWMVFKVKQRAKTNYYDKIVQKAGVSDETEATKLSKVSYNWPYDFFSMIELVKLESSMLFAELEELPEEPEKKEIKKIMTKKIIPKPAMMQAVNRRNIAMPRLLPPMRMPAPRNIASTVRQSVENNTIRVYTPRLPSLF